MPNRNAHLRPNRRRNWTDTVTPRSGVTASPGRNGSVILSVGASLPKIGHTDQNVANDIPSIKYFK